MNKLTTRPRPLLGLSPWGEEFDDLFRRHVVVSTPHAASDVPVDLPPGAAGLLVADEAHRYGAPTWGAALRDEFTLRLALTATYERNDDGVIDGADNVAGQALTGMAAVGTNVTTDRIRAVQVWLLARSTRPDQSLVDNRTYVVARQRYTAPANLQAFPRRLLTETFKTRNL